MWCRLTQDRRQTGSGGAKQPHWAFPLSVLLFLALLPSTLLTSPLCYECDCELFLLQQLLMSLLTIVVTDFRFIRYRNIGNISFRHNARVWRIDRPSQHSVVVIHVKWTKTACLASLRWRNYIVLVFTVLLISFIVDVLVVGLSQ